MTTKNKDNVVISMTIRDCFITVTLYPEGQMTMNSNVIQQDLSHCLSDLAEFSKRAKEVLSEQLVENQSMMVH